MSGGAVAAPGSSEVPNHSAAFRTRRFWNWFPLGLTYATFYMGRYNFNVVKKFLGTEFHLDKAELGVIATSGFWTYALALMLNGPLTDRFGGKRAILLGAFGVGLFNMLIGLLFMGGWSTHIVLGMSLLYAANSYFQSFGAISVVKVNAPWFHLKERGVFGGLFGIMISSGYALAITVGGKILGLKESGWPWALVFIIPAIAVWTMGIVDVFAVKGKPSEAGHPDFDTGDASSGDDDKPLVMGELLKKVFSNKVIVTIAVAEFCTGFVRQGLLLYFAEFLDEKHGIKAGSALFAAAGTGITIGGIVGGLVCGWLSDKVFQSRRPPVAFIFYCLQIPSLLMLQYVSDPTLAAGLVGFCCTWIFGVHGMLSGTASMDFGGKKAAATTAGLLDGIQYVASGFTGFGLGWVLEHYHWDVWTWTIVPFSVFGALLMTRLWNERPNRASAH